MKNFIFVLIVICCGVTLLFGQAIDRERIGVGISLGGQRLYGDIINTGFGIGFDAYAKYRVNNKFSTGVALGYGELSDGTFHVDEQTFSTNMITFDVRGSYHFMNDFLFKPSVYLGLGILNFRNEKLKQRYFDGSLFYGGCIEYMINPQIALMGSADYRFTTSDDLDDPALKGKAKDGYLSLRTGITYYLTPQSDDMSSPRILADAVPIDEIDGMNLNSANGDSELDALIEGIDSFEEASSSENNMEEYIKLKSKVEDLNDKIQMKELAMEELRSQLLSRQSKVTELEQRMHGRGGFRETSMSIDGGDLSSNYERALEHYYAKEYDAAINVFNVILNTYPRHRLASNCQYWIGESFFGKQHYEAAIDAFRLVLNYNNSAKRDDALLMIGRSYLKIGDSQSATDTFRRLINEFPESEYYAKAVQYTSRL